MTALRVLLYVILMTGLAVRERVAAGWRPAR